jgi:colanic acid biosynthesis glycosyl transferase WcaI
MPSKLLGMLASGRPVVATASADSELATAVAQCGVVTPPGDVVAFADALRMLADDFKMRCRLGDAARSVCTVQWDRDRILSRFEETLKNLADGC